jgi:hypothetical protein
MDFKILGETVVDESLLKTLEDLSTSSDKKVKRALADDELSVKEMGILNPNVDTDYIDTASISVKKADDTWESLDCAYKILDQKDLIILNNSLEPERQLTAKQFGDLGNYVRGLYKPYVAINQNDIMISGDEFHTPLPEIFKNLGFTMESIFYDGYEHTTCERISLALSSKIMINPLPEGGKNALLPGKPPLFTSIESKTSAERMQLIIKTNYDEVYTINIEYGNPVWTGTFLNSESIQIGNVEQYELFAVRPEYDYAKSHIQLPTYAEDVSFKDRAIDYVFGNADGSVSDFERGLHQKFMANNSHGTAYVEITTDHDNLVSVKSVEHSHKGAARGQDVEYLAIDFKTERVMYKKNIKDSGDMWKLTDQPNLPTGYEFLKKEK